MGSTALVPTHGLSVEQLEQRRLGIGASEVGAVLGLDRYRTPLDVWLEKTGRRPINWEPQSQAAKMGTLLEPIVALLAQEHYGVQHGNAQVSLETCDTLVSEQYPWMRATPDRIVSCASVFAEDDGTWPVDRWLLECKTKNWNTFKAFGAPGTDQVPDTIQLQCLWQMAVTRFTHCDVAVLVDGRDFHLYTLLWHQQLADAVIDRIGTWWKKYVEGDIEPPLAAGRDVHYLREKFASATAELAKPTPQLVEAVRLLARARRDFAQAEEQKDLATANVMRLLGDAKGVHTEHGKVSWSNVKGRASTDWKRVCAEAQVPPSIIEASTTIGPPSRQFRFTPATED